MLNNASQYLISPPNSDLILRKLDFKDEQALWEIRTNEVVNKFIKRPKIENIEDIREFLIKINKGIITLDHFYWGIRLKNSAKLIGTICLWNFAEDRRTAELGYELLPDFHRQGIMTEAIQAILTFAWGKLRLETIEAFTHKDNVASMKLLEKNGFQLEIDRKDEGFPHNIVFALHRDEVVNS